MARGNMVVTLVAQTKDFSNGLKNAGRQAVTFGRVLKAGFTLAMSAIGALAGALFTFIPNLVRMAEESRKSERRLANIAKQMGVFGKNTDEVTRRLSDYAESISFATGVDDELIRGAEAILLTFKNIAKTAGTVGGAFDRATMAALDLAAAGFGDVETNAKQLGKALQDPIKGLAALRRAGVTFTDAERKKIQALVEGNKLLEAQELILSAIETQVGGTAEATASSMDKIGARFEAIGEQLGEALLPAVDELAQQMGDWLDSVEGKNAIKNLTQQLSDLGAWITSPEGTDAVKEFAGAVVAIGNAMIAVGKGLQAVYKVMKDIGKWLTTDQGRLWLNTFSGGGAQGGIVIPDSLRGDANDWITGNGRITGQGMRSPVTVNVTGITPSVTIGKTVQQAVKDAQRLGAR